MTMKKRHERHLNQILNESVARISRKYRDGQRRHGGDLYRKSACCLVEEAINEAVDQLVYLLTLRQKLFKK